MDVINRTPFPVGPVPGRFGFPGYSATFVVKATVALVQGGSAVVVDEQPSLTGDIPFDDDPEQTGPPRYEMDFAPWKPQADVLLVGHCHAPGGEPVTRAEVGLTVGDRRIALQVTGDRYWRHGVAGAVASDPQPFTTMPLRYERAFGGPGDARNPVGVGAGADQVLATGDAGLRLPNIEYPDRLVRVPGDNPGPAGLGPLPRSWVQRSRFMGTFDTAWETGRWPWYPEDFDWRFWNAAATPMFTGYLEGSESIELTNLHPQYPRYRTRLPDIRPRLYVRRPGDEAALEPVPLQLDTLWIDADAEQAVLLWRGVCAAADHDYTDIEQIYLDAEQASAASRPDAYFLGRYRRTLAEIEAEWAMEPELPAPPEDTVETTEDDVTEPEVDPDAEHMDALEALAESLAKDAAPLPLEDDPAELDRRLQENAERAGHEHEPAEDEPEPPAGWTREALVALDRSTALEGEDFSGLDLSGLDLSGRLFRGCLFSGAILEGTRLDGADLSASDLSGCRLDRAGFNGAWLVDANLTGATGQGVDFSSARMLRCLLSGAVLSDALFRAALMTDADLTAADLLAADFTEARLHGARLEEAVLRNADFSRVDAEDASFVNAVMTRVRAVGGRFPEAEFSGASLPGGDFRDALLRDAIFEGAHGQGAVMDGAEMTGFRAAEASDFSAASFRQCNMPGATWEHANLRGADLAGACCDGADFSGSCLAEACLDAVQAADAVFRGADLSAARLRLANLFNASLERARLAGTDLSGANCYGVEFLDADYATAVLSGANLHMTKLATSIGHG